MSEAPEGDMGKVRGYRILLYASTTAIVLFITLVLVFYPGDALRPLMGVMPLLVLAGFAGRRLLELRRRR